MSIKNLPGSALCSATQPAGGSAEASPAWSGQKHQVKCRQESRRLGRELEENRGDPTFYSFLSVRSISLLISLSVSTAPRVVPLLQISRILSTTTYMVPVQDSTSSEENISKFTEQPSTVGWWDTNESLPHSLFSAICRKHPSFSIKLGKCVTQCLCSRCCPIVVHADINNNKRLVAPLCHSWPIIVSRGARWHVWQERLHTHP